MFRFLNHWITKLFISICTVFAPIQAVLSTVLFLVFADLVTGVWAAKKRKETITSRKLGRSITKFCIYEVAILLGFLAEHYLTGSILPLCSIISSFIGLTEILSLIENLNTISSQNLFKYLIDKLKRGED
jgi:hypothetical protein